MFTANTTASSTTSRLRSGSNYISPFPALFYGKLEENIPSLYRTQ